MSVCKDGAMTVYKFDYTPTARGCTCEGECVVVMLLRTGSRRRLNAWRQLGTRGPGFPPLPLLLTR